MNNESAIECLGTKYIEGFAECLGPSETLSTLVGESACGGCIRLCVDDFRSTREKNIELEQKVEDLGYDELTGLLTRRALVEEFESFREQNRSFAVFFLDIANFKEYNANYGHRGGDTVLRAIGYALKENLRTEDATYVLESEDTNGVASRRGGDEFVLLIDLPQVQDAAVDRRTSWVNNREQAKAFAERLHLNFNDWLQESFEVTQVDTPEGEKIRPHVSLHIGYAVSHAGDSRGLDHLIHEADPVKE